jgi:hypothetical protein
LGEVVSEQLKVHWCERLYEAKATELILYGRALGLSHGEAEDVLHETFAELPARPVAEAHAGAGVESMVRTGK